MVDQKTSILLPACSQVELSFSIFVINFRVSRNGTPRFGRDNTTAFSGAVGSVGWDNVVDIGLCHLPIHFSIQTTR